MPFEYHDGLLSVAKVIVVNTVIWRKGRKEANSLISWEGCTGSVIIIMKILPTVSTSHFKPHLGKTACTTARVFLRRLPKTTPKLIL